MRRLEKAIAMAEATVGEAIDIIGQANSPPELKCVALGTLTAMPIPNSRRAIYDFIEGRSAQTRDEITTLAQYCERRVNRSDDREIQSVIELVLRAFEFRKGHPIDEHILGQPPNDPELYCLEADDNTLWDAARSSRTHIRLRTHALQELLNRGDPKLPVFIASELQKPTRSPEWQEELAAAASRVHFTTGELRQSVADCLWNIILQHKNSSEREREGILWKAVRRFATLRPQANVSLLAKLIPSTEHCLPFQHVLLLSVANAFSGTPPSKDELPQLSALCSWIEATAQHFLTMRVLATPDERSIALSSLCAAGVLPVPSLPELCSLALERKERWLVSLTLKQWTVVLERWNTYALDPAFVVWRERLAQAIRRLDESLMIEPSKEGGV